MDDQTLNALRAAHEASPENSQLLLALLLGLRERDQFGEAAELLARYEPGHLEPAGRLTAASILLAAEEAERALRWADFESAEAALVRARACLALGRTEQGRGHYDQALKANPTLEDPTLAEQLKTRVRDVDRGDDRPRLRVISKDDTVEDEASNLLVPDPEPVTFAQVGGLDDVKKQIHRKIILPFQKPSLFRKFRKRIGGGILLYGPPGCGKTLLARATAGECGAAFFNVAISDVLDMYIGESEQKLHALFEKARSSVPRRAVLRRAGGARRQAPVHARGGVFEDRQPVLIRDGRFCPGQRRRADPRRNERALGGRSRLPPARSLRSGAVRTATGPRSPTTHSRDPARG